jgi:hypothetical protein
MDGISQTYEFLNWLSDRLDRLNSELVNCPRCHRERIKSEYTECEIILGNFKRIFGINPLSEHPHLKQEMAMDDNLDQLVATIHKSDRNK